MTIFTALVGLKENRMSNYLKGLILFFIFSSCNEKIKISAPVPTSYAIYCWSFFSCNDTTSPFTLTSTQISVPASQIMKKEYLILNENDSARSLSFYNLLLENKNNSIGNKPAMYADSRFVIQLNYKNKSSDTLVYYSDSSFYLNDKSLIHYNFRVLDSVRSKVNIKCFECVH